MTPTLVLASRSPRRHELLSQIGVAYEIVDADIDETRNEGEAPAAYVERCAREKAQAGQVLKGADRWVLGADTTVVVDHDVIGKPADREQAAKMLGRLSGRQHEVWSGVALAGPDQWLHSRVQVSRVTFAEMDPAWIKAYCQTEEPMDKAGAYAVQGRTAAYITRLDGSFSSVMGLPLLETAQLLELAGLASLPR